LTLFQEQLKTVLEEKNNCSDALTHAQQQIKQLEQDVKKLKESQLDDHVYPVNKNNPNETETERLKRENSELISRCANLRINVSRLTNTQKEQKEKKTLLLQKLTKCSEEIIHLNLKNHELQEKLSRKETSVKRKSDEIQPSVPDSNQKVMKLMDLKLE